MSTTEKCLNHPRRRVEHTLFGVGICSKCARSALAYLLTEPDAEPAAAAERNGVAEQLGIGAES